MNELEQTRLSFCVDDLQSGRTDPLGGLLFNTNFMFLMQARDIGKKAAMALETAAVHEAYVLVYMLKKLDETRAISRLIERIGRYQPATIVFQHRVSVVGFDMNEDVIHGALLHLAGLQVPAAALPSTEPGEGSTAAELKAEWEKVFQAYEHLFPSQL